MARFARGRRVCAIQREPRAEVIELIGQRSLCIGIVCDNEQHGHTRQHDHEEVSDRSVFDHRPLGTKQRVTPVNPHDHSSSFLITSHVSPRRPRRCVVASMRQLATGRSIAELKRRPTHHYAPGYAPELPTPIR